MDSFLKKWRKIVLLLSMCTLYFFSYFHRVAVPGICFDELQHDFTATASAVAALGSIFLYVYAFAQFFIGTLADRFGGRRTMLAGTGILAAASILFPLSGSLPLLYLTRAVIAVGASTIFISLVKEIDTLFDPRHFTIWLGIALFIGYSGGLAGTYPFERAVSHFGWRNALLGMGLLCLLALTVAAVIFHALYPNHAPAAANKANYIGVVLKNRLTYPPAIAGSINFAIYFLFQGALGKKMLTDCCAISSGKAALIIFIMMLCSMMAVSLSGFVSYLIGNRRKPVILGSVLLTMATAGFMAIMARNHPGYRFMGTGLITLGVASSISPIIISSAKEVNISSAAATSAGIVNCAAYIIVAALINAGGLVLDLFREHATFTSHGIIYPVMAYRLILSGCTALSAVSVVMALFIRETKGAYIKAGINMP